MRKLLRFRWLIFLVLALAYLLVYFHRLSMSVVADDLVRDFSTTAGVMGLLGSMYFYCYACMQFPAGLLADSLGPRRAVTAFLIVASAGSIVFGLAPNVHAAFLGRILVGFGVSVVFTPTMKILSQWFRAGEFALMVGILNAMGGAGALTATWLLALMAATLGWRISFELIGGCTLVLVVLIWFVVRDRPEDKGWPSIAQIEQLEDGHASTPQQIPLWEGARRVISEKYFWAIAVWFFFNGGVFFSFGGLWSGPYLIHVYGMSQAEAGAILSMIAWGMICGSPFLGVLSDRLWKSRKKVIVACTAILASELLLVNLFPAGLPRAALYPAFFLFAICASSVVAIAFTTTKELFPVAIAGTSVGTVNLFPFLGGALFMPALGWILDAYPRSERGAYQTEAYAVVLLVLFVASMISLACSLMMKETLTPQSSAPVEDLR